MKIKSTRRLVYTSLCIAIGMILPQFIKTIPMANPGAIFLPMHIPVLLCGFLCGAPCGAVCGIILPLLNGSLTGRPVLFPVGVSMMFELCTYGALAGLFYRFTKGKIYPTLIGAMLGGRLVLGIVNTIIFSFADKKYGMMAFIYGSTITALPGIIIQIILIPAIVYAMKKNRVSK